MPKVTSKKAASTPSRPPDPRAAMQLASLHLACLHLQYHATNAYANVPQNHGRISKILQGASAKVAKLVNEPPNCGDGFYDCNGTCIPEGQSCIPPGTKGPKGPK